MADVVDEGDEYNFDEVATVMDVGPFRMSSGGGDDARSTGSSLSSGTTGVGTRRYGAATGGHGGGGAGSSVYGYSRNGSGSGGRSTSARSITARSRAGYSSRSGEESQKNKNVTSASGTAAGSASVRDRDPAQVAKEMVGDIHRCLDESALLLHRGDLLVGLDKAKEAGKMERRLGQFRDTHSLSENGSQDYDALLFGTWFHLALAYEKNSMYEEASKTYTYLARQKQIPSSWKAQVNLGNILYRQDNYAEAIKSYQMALDRIPPEERQVGFKVCSNVGHALIRLGRYRDASERFEAAMSATIPDYETAFNLLLCQLVKGDAEKAQKVFVKMLTLPLEGYGSDTDRHTRKTAAAATAAADETEDEREGRKDDDLGAELARRRKVADDLVINAARLVAPIVGSSEDTLANGLHWAIETVKDAEYQHLACILENELAVHHLRNKNVDQATKILKAFERKDQDLMATGSTNLSFLCLLERDLDGAMHQASLAVTSNRYDAKALVNLGCSYYMQQDFGRARDCFHEALTVEAGCVQALYNLGLTNLELQDFDAAVQVFERVLQLVPNHPEALYWLSRIGPEKYAVIFQSLLY
mmetsp:Transcript_36078/g.79005  ORF Transcript_36078/g.79005 Transcript_36078/m.79005 type:complete len:588 (+) Transcript_36078:314-2077(+)|eukprot:CAMPEP_0178490982 /NCGR_PEP_ID=MMETSP0696-20121128/11171_1 /TAXON_ID=265572 /ORGANISM="Extubocellulus spinifer, Strain CCMP396" /LENGTH=587 /DNA_ID=CAMNT_0020118829 /DNA_START=239 /DNA_END=1999 /DNA_ORIENTATION=-